MPPQQWIPGWLKGRRERARAATCVYLSSGAVATVHGRAQAGGTALEGGFDLAVRADPLDGLDDMAATLKTQVQSLGIRNGPAHIVLAPEFYTLSLVERPSVPDEDLVEAVRWQVQDNVEFPVDQASIDVFDLPHAASRDRDMVFVVVARKDFLASRIEQIQQAGLLVDSIGITELSMRNLIATLFPEPDQSIALVRMTSNSGLINVSRSAELFLSRRITGVPGDFDEEAWESFQNTLLLQVQRSVDYYESAMGQPPCNALLVAATHSWQSRVCEFLTEMMPVPIRGLSEALSDRFAIELHNPDAQQIDWDAISDTQANALAAALPAIGGLLRELRPEALADAA
ncbi:MAG: hypothetical protein AAGI15_01610 [Pseudomonadota bacterium]